MKYLTKFETEEAYKAFIASSEFISPNVSLVAGTVKYEPNWGVYIQHIDGSLYTTDEWTAREFTSNLANGVAVINKKSSFVIATQNVSSGVWSAQTSVLVEGVMTTTDSVAAKTDFAGAANTALIVALGNSGCAYNCTKYTFPNGQKGYLPALGEWQIAYDNKAAIVAAMALIGGVAIGDRMWSSTQIDTMGAWVTSFNSGEAISSYFKRDNCGARPFAELKI